MDALVLSRSSRSVCECACVCAGAVVGGFGWVGYLKILCCKNVDVKTTNDANESCVALKERVITFAQESEGVRVLVFECVGLLREVRLPVCHVCVGGCVGMRVGEQMCGFDVE